MTIRKPDLLASLPDGWTRTDESADIDTPLTFEPSTPEAGALQVSLPIGFDLAPSPAEQLELVCARLDWGRPTDLEPFESTLGPGCIATAPAGAPIDVVWIFQPSQCPFVLATWTGDPRFVATANEILSGATCGRLMSNELWLLAAVEGLVAELSLGEDLVPHALIIAGPMQRHHVLAGGQDELEMLTDYLRHEVQTKRAELVSVCGEYRRRYPNEETHDVVTLYIESPDSVRQYEFATDASVEPRRIGPLEIVAATGWGPVVDLFHRLPSPENVERARRLAEATEVE